MSDGSYSPVRLYSLIALMVMFWSANFSIGKHVLQAIPALLTIGMRTVIAATAMLFVYRWWTASRGRPVWRRSDLPLLLALGLIGVGGNQLLFVVGLSRTSVAHAAIMIGLSPMLVMIIAAMMKQEHLSGGRLLGMCVALTGVGVLQTASEPGRSATFVGDLFVLAASATFAWFTVRGKAEIHRLGGVTVNTFGYVSSAIAMLPMTATFAWDFDFSSVPATAWAGLLYMAVFPSVICYLIYYHALRHIPASRLSAFAYLQPLIATLIAIPTLGEYPTKTLLMGGALVLAGVYATERL